MQLSQQFFSSSSTHMCEILLGWRCGHMVGDWGTCSEHVVSGLIVIHSGRVAWRVGSSRLCVLRNMLIRNALENVQQCPWFFNLQIMENPEEPTLVSCALRDATLWFSQWVHSCEKAAWPGYVLWAWPSDLPSTVPALPLTTKQQHPAQLPHPNNFPRKSLLSKSSLVLGNEGQNN